MFPFNKTHDFNRPLAWHGIPSLRLRPYIEGYYGVIIPPSEPLNFGHRDYPNGSVHLQFVFGSGGAFETSHAYHLTGVDTKRPKMAVIQPRSVTWRAKLEESPDFVLVQFKPGMAAPFLNLSLSELNTWENVEDIWPPSALERLSTIEFLSVQDRIEIIEEVLLECLEQSTLTVDPIVHHAIQRIENGMGRLEIQTLADQLHISGRQLRRKFQHYVGHTPKQFNKIVRFHYANRLLQNYPNMTLTDVAHRSGYFDLAHFTHAIREITGISPTQMSRIDQKEAELNEQDIDSIVCPVLLAV